MYSSAIFSLCGKYRYSLTRLWDDRLPPMVVIGHNPSTADETVDDPTIRKCVGFAKSSGHGGLQMVNLCAWLATDPKALDLLEDPVGPHNDSTLRDICSDAVHRGGIVVAAWGQLASKGRSMLVQQRPDVVLSLLSDFDIHTFRITKKDPWHPLYLPKDTLPKLWRHKIASLSQ